MNLIKWKPQKLFGRKPAGPAEVEERLADTGQSLPTGRAVTVELDIAPDDPLLRLLLTASGVIDVEGLALDSPALERLKAAGVKIAAPLVSQGELIGVLSLGPRLSEQDYSGDDRRLVASLATQAAPALRVAQLARQQQIEARRSERIAQELRVARIIQQTLLPKELPALPGWELAAHWQPAREMSGDFYDFLTLPDGRLALIIADVTDKGVPAALVMATTRSMLRAAAEHIPSPGALLERVNELLCPDIPANMFVTCLVMVLDPHTGRIEYANAGHNLPHLQTAEGVVELRATGMPLGLLPGMTYAQKEVTLAPGCRLLLYTDGLVEAHNPDGEMFSTPRLRELMAAPLEAAVRSAVVAPAGMTGETSTGDTGSAADISLSEAPASAAGASGGFRPSSGAALIARLSASLAEFTGPGWEQEDDVTFVTLEYLAASPEPAYRTLAEFELPSQAGNERQAIQTVAAAVSTLDLSEQRLEHLKTAVGEAVMNAIEHGNRFQPGLPVSVQVLASAQRLVIHVHDQGSGQTIPELRPAALQSADLEARLDGRQAHRGWGVYLLQHWVDEINSFNGGERHTLELIWNLE